MNGSMGLCSHPATMYVPGTRRETAREVLASSPVRDVAAPPAHVLVCANERDAASALGAGCGARGEALYAAFKDAVAARGAYRSVWITKTHCLGVCPREGATCALADGRGRRILAEVVPGDVPELFASLVDPGPAQPL